MWAGIDYRGEGTGWPTIRSQHGVFDICRFPKEAYYYYKQEWCNEPMVHLATHWNYHEREGKNMDIWCYSNCEEVELFHNGKFLGCKESVPHGHITWNLEYQPGVLSAKGKKSGEVICETKIETAGAPAALKIEADRRDVRADGEDLIFLIISVTDVNGVFCAEAADCVTVKVEGKGRLVGISSGDPRSHESCRGKTIKVFKGLMLAVVQTDNESGEIIITAASPKLEQAVCTCNSQNRIKEKYCERDY